MSLPATALAYSKLISLSVVSLKVAEPIDTIKEGLTIELVAAACPAKLLQPHLPCAVKVLGSGF